MVGLTEDAKQSMKLVHYTCIHTGTFTSTEDGSKLRSYTGISDLQTNSENTVRKGLCYVLYSIISKFACLTSKLTMNNYAKKEGKTPEE